MSSAIQFENVSKQYRLGEVGTGTLSHDLHRAWAKLRGKSDPFAKVGETNNREKVGGEYIWALKDINFEVKQGEIIGIIGRNGAGKSTLLKLLSRVTAPTIGSIKSRGKIASLLEVGTGFHPELTGKENIYLNGAILGMRKPDIRRRMEEIVEFSGCAKYIDTPVKRYSSGMMVRLGFAVAAHLDCNTLIVDEVLAVGDADFQKKCIGKMRDVSSDGRTILLVSHNMGSISSLCTRAALLQQGSITQIADPAAVIINYLHGSKKEPIRDFSSRDHIGDHRAKLRRVWVEDSTGTPSSDLAINEYFTVNMEYECLVEVPIPPYPNFHFFDERGEYAFVTSAIVNGKAGTTKGVYIAKCCIPKSLLNDGTYFIGVALTFTHGGIHISFFEKDALSIHITDPLDETIDKTRCGYAGRIPGPVRPQLDWKIERI